MNRPTPSFVRSRDQASNREHYSWRALTMFNLYRFLVAGGMVLLFELNLGPSFLGQDRPDLYRHTTAIYLLLTLLTIPLVYRRQPNVSTQVVLMVLIDIVCITLAMHASGGVPTGLGMLLGVSITTTSLLLARPWSLTFAALASVAIVTEQTWSFLAGQRSINTFTQTGILGATFFAMSALALMLARRIRETEAAAEASRVSLAKLERLNEHIIQYMNAGVLVVDKQQQIQLINHAAWTLLGMPNAVQHKPLEEVSPALLKQLRHWRRNPEMKGEPFRMSNTGPDLLPAFTGLGTDQQLTLIFLEDTSKTTQQATQMKLASLGRLTASIAHEIRNPLGALSHAAQLLKESPDIGPADQRLVDIIEKHSARMNNIIENILQISQRRPSKPERIALAGFLHNFVEDFKLGRSPAPEILADISPRDIVVLFDVGQLIQVLTNLCENGMRYSIRKVNRPLLELHAGIDKTAGRPFLDVIDYGEGINPEVAEKMFEPFFTTSSKGLGLGLYLARELCEANQAQLNYLPIPSGGTCFRISFAPAQRTIPAP
ncbi:MAG: sensor histidine kinase [Pseudomonadota bacterium]